MLDTDEVQSSNLADKYRPKKLVTNHPQTARGPSHLCGLSSVSGPASSFEIRQQLEWTTGRKSKVVFQMAPAVDDLETPLSMTLSDHDDNEPQA